MKMFNYVLQGRWLSARVHFTIEVSGRLAATGYLCSVLTQLQEERSKRLAGGQNFGYNACMDIQTQQDKDIIQGWIFAVRRSLLECLQLQVCFCLQKPVLTFFSSHQMHM